MARSTVSYKRRNALLFFMLLLGIMVLFLREESLIVAVLDDTRFTSQQNGILSVLTGGGPLSGHEMRQNIFFDDVSFSELTTYSTYISGKIPTNWLQLNDQLLCPIHNSRTLNPSFDSNGDEIMLKILYRLQFKENCFSADPLNKFLVFDLSTAGTRGLGAVVNALWIKMLYRALYTNRTLMIIGNWSWSGSQSFCRGKEAMECYLLPPSNCKYEALISHFGMHSQWKGGLPSHCEIGDNKSLPICKERIITIVEQLDGYLPRPSVMDRWLLSRYRFNYNVFRAVATSFLLRLNPQVRSIVYSKVRNSWITSLGMDSNAVINPMSTLALPIRESDKCRGHTGGEMECWTLDEYLSFLEAVSILSSHRIDTVIITSEATQFVQNLSDRIQSEMGSKWRVILNKDDVSSQVGAADYIIHRERYRDWIRYSDRRLNSKLEYDPIVGALSSFLLQISTAKYMVFTKSSNWLDLMYAVAKSLDCNAQFWSGQFAVNNWNDGKRDMQRQRESEMDIERPAFMQSGDGLTLRIRKHCFEFNQWGLANKRTFRKSISMPPDLWEELRRSSRDYEFGVNIKEHRPCSRYDIHPFERSDTLY